MDRRKRAAIVIGCTTAVIAAVVLITFHPWRPSPPMYSLRTSASPAAAGYVAVYPPGGKYEPGVELTLQAVPNFGYRFVSWSGDISSTDGWTTMTMSDSNKNVVAVFESAELTTYEVHDVTIPSESYFSFPPDGIYLQEGQRVRLSYRLSPNLDLYLFSERQFEHFKPDLIPLLGSENGYEFIGNRRSSRGGRISHNDTYCFVIANRIPFSPDGTLYDATIAVQQPDP